MIDSTNVLSVRAQSKLLNICCSQIYYKSMKDDEDNLKEMIMNIYLSSPVFGYRKIGSELADLGYKVNNKKVLRLMKELNISALYPKKRTSIKDSSHKLYPYLLDGLLTERPHQVWQVDITYIKLPQGHMYLTAIIDVYSRYVVSWRLSNDLCNESCLRAIEDGVARFGEPEIINSDQGGYNLRVMIGLSTVRIKV